MCTSGQFISKSIWHTAVFAFRYYGSTYLFADGREEGLIPVDKIVIRGFHGLSMSGSGNGGAIMELGKRLQQGGSLTESDFHSPDDLKHRLQDASNNYYKDIRVQMVIMGLPQDEIEDVVSRNHLECDLICITRHGVATFFVRHGNVMTGGMVRDYTNEANEGDVHCWRKNYYSHGWDHWAVVGEGTDPCYERYRDFDPPEDYVQGVCMGAECIVATFNKLHCGDALSISVISNADISKSCKRKAWDIALEIAQRNFVCMCILTLHYSTGRERYANRFSRPPTIQDARWRLKQYALHISQAISLDEGWKSRAYCANLLATSRWKSELVKECIDLLHVHGAPEMFQEEFYNCLFEAMMKYKGGNLNESLAPLRRAADIYYEEWKAGKRKSLEFLRGVAFELDKEMDQKFSSNLENQ